MPPQCADLLRVSRFSLLSLFALESPRLSHLDREGTMVSSKSVLALMFVAPLYVAAFVGSPLASLGRHSRALSCRQRASPSSVSNVNVNVSMMTTTTPKPFQLPADGSFEETVLKSEVPVLVDFHASWCAPCMLLAPIMDKVAVEYEGRLQVVKVDCDTHKDLMNLYRARGLPLMVIFNGGEVVARQEGILNFEGMVKLLGAKVPELQ